MGIGKLPAWAWKAAIFAAGAAFTSQFFIVWCDLIYDCGCTFDALGGRAVLDLEQGRHGDDVVVPGQREVCVVDDPVGGGGERRLVLGDGRDRRPVGQVDEHRRDEHAGRAVLLDDGDETVGERSG